MTIYHETEDEIGDLLDLIPMCSHSCHRMWCHDNGIDYPGDCMGHDGSDAGEWCVYCGVIVSQPDDWTACRCGWDNVVVNRFRVDAPVICEHGLTIQQPITDNEGTN